MGVEDGILERRGIEGTGDGIGRRKDRGRGLIFKGFLRDERKENVERVGEEIREICESLLEIE